MEGNILFIIGGPLNSTDFCHLGHELHAARSLIFDLLSKNIISPNQTTIVTLEDRLFLYNHVFKNSISHINNKLNSNNYSHIINLDKNFLSDPRQGFCNIDYFHEKTNYIFKGIYNPVGFNNYKNEIFCNYVTSCNCDILNPFDSEFIIVHYRNYKNIPNIKCWNYETDDNINELKNLLTSLKKNYKNIIIFGNLMEKINIDGLNIKICNNLKEYVSFMKSEKCKALISVWSGAGQLGQFFFNKEILYYMNKNQTQSFKFPCVSKEIYYGTINDMHSWDFQTFSNCKRYWFMDINHLKNFFKNNYYINLNMIYNKYLFTDEFLSFGNE